jgi:outer membrane protein OmpA-like peptidoglycan-associated protein
MRNWIKRGTLVAFVAVCAGGCATKSMIVLMPDESGQVGAVTVSNAGGTTQLDESGEAVLIGSADEISPETTVLADEKIEKTFGDALAASPPKPKVFMLEFKSDSAEPAPDSAALVDAIVAEIGTRKSKDIAVNGHTDRSGDRNYNMQLSNKRAAKIQAMLVERGVERTYISVDFHGEGDPVVPTADGVHEPRNRRVEVVIR